MKKTEEKTAKTASTGKFDLSKIGVAITGLKKEYGDICVNTTEVSDWKRVPTSSPTLGYIFGKGGTPMGSIIELYGPESGGKSLIAQNVVADFQKDGRFAVYIDTEYSFNAEYAQVQGVDVSAEKFLLLHPDTGEDAWDSIIAMVKTGQVGVIVLDSLATCLPSAEANGSMKDQQMGAQARMIGKGLRKLLPVAGKSGCTVILINQIRMKIGCVGPDTMLDIDDKLEELPIAKLFLEDFFVDYNDMTIGKPLDVIAYDKKIKSIAPDTNKEEYRLITKIIRKPDSKAYLVSSKENSFKCSADHKIAVKDLIVSDTEYTYMTALDTMLLLKIHECRIYVNGVWEKFEVKALDETVPILDLEVEGNHNYFSNGILSHNTVFGNPECVTPDTLIDII